MSNLNPFRPLLMPSEGKCPICGRIIDKSLGCCWYCHQRFYQEENLPNINEDIIYITITTFIGWVGCGPSYHIAINVITKIYSALKVESRTNAESEIILSSRLIKKLCKNYTQLFHCKEIQENRIQAYDCSIYFVNVQKGERTFQISVYDFLLDKWSLLCKIIDEIEKRKIYDVWIRKILTKLENL